MARLDIDGARRVSKRIRAGSLFTSATLETARDATKDWDRSIGSYVWAANSESIYLSAEDHGEQPIYVAGVE